jgi:uncharacterized protein involved in response to NO
MSNRKNSTVRSLGAKNGRQKAVPLAAGAQRMPVLFHAPHRVMFLAGGIQMLAALCWWTVELAARAGWLHSPPWPLYAGWLHAAWLIYGMYPFFIFGFLMTAMPRWQNAEPVAARSYIASAALCSLGWLVFWIGLAVPVALPLGVVLVLAGWLVALKDFLRVANCVHPDRVAPRLVLAALSAGAMGLTLLLARTVGATDMALRAALDVGIWWFLAPVFVVVSHRMIPFFSSVVIANYAMYRPYVVLHALIATFVVHGALVVAGAGQWTWPADLTAASFAAHLTVRWRFRASLAVPLLGMLHIGFAWLWIAMALLGLQSLAQFLGYAIPGLAPLHALTIGYFSSMLLAMASRVTLGHAGRSLTADRLTLATFAGLQLVALTRMLADALPASVAGALLVAAALGWLAAFGAWFLRFAPSYWRPRADGRPG